MDILFLEKMFWSIILKEKISSVHLTVKSRFWQIQLIEESKPLTTFSTSRGYYQWTVTSFGFNISPQIFERWMDGIFKDINILCVIYIDGILVFSKQ